MNRYNQTLQVQLSAQQVRNELGDIETMPAAWQTISKCREQPNGKGTTVTTTNGDVKTYSSSIFAPTSCPEVAENAKVRVLDKLGNVVFEGICQRYHRYIHYVKVWV